MNTKSISLVKASSQEATINSQVGFSSGSFTIEVWVKPSSTPSGGQNNFIVAHGMFGNSTDIYLSYVDVSGTPKLRIERTKQCVQQSTVDYTVTLSTTVWTHLVIRYDSAAALLKLFSAAQGGTHSEVSSVSSASGNGTCVVHIV